MAAALDTAILTCSASPAAPYYRASPCNDARTRLQRRYGMPVADGAGEGGRYDSWRNEKDTVVFIYRTDPGPRCMILLSSTSQPSTGFQPAGSILTVAGL